MFVGIGWLPQEHASNVVEETNLELNNNTV